MYAVSRWHGWLVVFWFVLIFFHYELLQNQLHFYKRTGTLNFFHYDRQTNPQNVWLYVKNIFNNCCAVAKMNTVLHTGFDCAVLFCLILLNDLKQYGVVSPWDMIWYLKNLNTRLFQSDMSLHPGSSPGSSPLGAHLHSCSIPCCCPVPEVPLSLNPTDADAMAEATANVQKLNNWPMGKIWIWLTHFSQH